MDCIKVSIDRDSNSISVYNNGEGIPVVVHADEKVYVPELIFGHLLTSSNYDDYEKKITGGRNGYGAKLCNIFSTEFIIETADLANRKKFKQVFKHNMSQKGDPLITSNSKDQYTKISFKPDLKKFGMSAMDDDLISLFSKRVYDLAGCCKGIKVYLNDERIPVRNFKQYTELYFNNMVENSEGELVKLTPVYETVNDRWELCVALSDGQFQQVSFVNSIYTYKGGTHVNYVADQIVSSLMDIVKKKNKAATVKPFQVKNHMWIFINSLIENPSFDSQTKENMTLRVSDFGSKCEISDDFLKRISKIGIVDNVLNWVKQKQDKELKKTDGHKSSRLSGIPKLDDANFAGTKQGHKCTLILTEGDSAKALAVSGLSIVGRDYFGVFPLRGKLLNVREANHKQIMENAEINNVKQILGLQHGKIYNSTESLRYGHLMIMTDQDHDGSHIKGLVINFLDHFWPSLLKIPGFLVEFITPIVKATKGKQEVTFFTLPEYEQWKSETQNGKGWFIKYYKGLGTSTAADAKKYFSSMKTHLKEFFRISDEERSLIDMAFNKKKADDRKEWLKNFVPGTFMDHSVEKIKYDDFIHKELILFSMADNIRSIPSVVDGLKPGLRKILFACFKRKLKEEIKVQQLAGYVAEHAAYHHGDASLCASIIGMAQDFVGSNNINLMFPSGQFGTRIQGGKDAASPRYVFTKLAAMTRLLYPADDDTQLNYLNDDGQSIEPEWYMPILPMLLVNGGEGIGTGWSTSIPNFSPKDLAEAFLIKLKSGQDFPHLHPWYRGFRGSIESLGESRYRICGVINKIDAETVEITELPVGSWTQTYKEFLETMMTSSAPSVQPILKDFKEYHTDTKVHFVLKFYSSDTLASLSPDDLDKKFKLSTTISLNNMVAFDAIGRIKKYNSILEILEEFYSLRLTFYQKRKEYLTKKLTEEWKKLDMKVKFIKSIIAGTLIIQKKKREALVTELKAAGYLQFSNSGSGGDVEDGIGAGYDYLLGMPLWSLTLERIAALESEKADKEKQLEELLALTPKDLWIKDLDCFLAELLRNKDFSHVISFKEGIASSLNSASSQKAASQKISKAAIVQKDTLDSFVDKHRNALSQPTPEDYSHLPLTERIQMMLKRTSALTVDASKNRETTASPSPFNPASSNAGEKLATKISKVAISKKSVKPKAVTDTDDDVELLPRGSKRKPALAIEDDSDNETIVVTRKKSQPALTAQAPASKKKSGISFSDDDDDDDDNSGDNASSFIVSDEEEDVVLEDSDDDNVHIVRKQPASKKRPVVGPARSGMVSSSVKVKGNQRPRAAASLKKKGSVSDEDDDFSELDDDALPVTSKPSIRAKAKKSYKLPSNSEVSSDDDSVFEEED